MKPRVKRGKRRLTPGDKRVLSCAWVLTDSGLAEPGSWPDLPPETPRRDTWEEFDREIEGGIRRGQFKIDPATEEVKHVRG